MRGRDPHFGSICRRDEFPRPRTSPRFVGASTRTRSDDFSLNAFPFKRRPDEVGIRCRSLMSILYFLSTAVGVPHLTWRKD